MIPEDRGYSSGTRVGALAVLYSVVLLLSQWLSYQLRFDFDVPPPYRSQLALFWWWILPLKLVFLYGFGQFSGLLSYFSIPDLRGLFYAISSSSMVLLLLRYFSQGYYTAPRGV